MVQAAKFWDKQAPSYAKAPIKNMDSYNYTLERTKSYLKASDMVLEIGAGTGSTAIELAPFVKHITATDISPAMTEIGAQKAEAQNIKNINFAAADANVSDLSGPFDAVLAHNVLHLVDDLPQTLSRARALLKQDGLFISKTFCKPEGFGSFTFHAIKLVLPLMQWIGKAPFVAFMSIPELEKSITEAGFKIIETGNYPAKEERRYIVAQKI